MVVFVIISMNNTIIFIGPMVKKKLKGKHQASCQDLKKKKKERNTTIEQLYLQRNHLAAAHNFDELGISTLKR